MVDVFLWTDAEDRDSGLEFTVILILGKSSVGKCSMISKRGRCLRI
jgi:hypothetical protein